ncbi:DNA cytosine methyltransferase [Leclercia adecarboxylata]|uniref:DNA (cytosine-5-)-methyltransferase n=1 Tax=Leclercia adecarboxylata TaxID=83655 RepID=A0ABU6I4Z5_9ENTR|nr:DNA cytosine methyltransferase [Leclercia adecarboxylata]MBZ3802093.1 DNA cytosine methyltransferase [Leclercia adecarboxylata]MBZ3806723.1 DNA cytosine methyltransferase [Leclercia adecarboxylata]MEC3903043.1 DNA cytosine methyltransferase [Leclercia adecarboxylata]MEC3936621.1 DNA cytosine methyltransferase [Leclercia adecarboxylata]QEY54890.1 DNA cytosine methyltransferase [Leclercia adecarboxylata]
MNELALFAGAGGGILGGHLLGWRTVCAVERDAYAAQVLAQRQNDGILRPFPIWSDVCGFDGKPWRGIVDVVSGGFPCQDISGAGKGAGIEGERSGLWKQMARIIDEVRPLYALLENSPLLVGRGLAMVIGDLASLGFDAQWCCVSASECGASHNRDRIWLVAYTQGKHGQSWDSVVQSPDGRAPIQSGGLPGMDASGGWRRGGAWPECEPRLCRVADDVAFGVDRLKALGNGQVPRVAAAAFSMLRGN